jgi:hypothetical protein
MLLRAPFMDMMLKQNNSHHNERVLICHAAVMHDKDAQIANCVESSFFIIEELFIMSSLQQSRWLIKLNV